jgi:phospholipid/cholesterol/gamma-HCH transport system permease protein
MALLTGRIEKGGYCKIIVDGAWTAKNAHVIETGFAGILAKAKDASSVHIDLKSLEELDTYGAWLLERLRRELSISNDKVEFSGVQSQNKILLSELAELGLDESERPDVSSASGFFSGYLDHLLKLFKNEFLSFFSMFGQVIAAAGRMIIHPANYRITSTVYQFDRVCWKALPIVLMVTFIIGAIIAQQGFFHFRRFGADLYVVDMTGFLIMREIGVLLVAIIIAGRSGSSFTAELGSMKMREEIDALKTMGFDPVQVLILPRVLVLIIALPVLTFLGSLAALFGSGLVATLYAGMTAELFIDRLRDAITMDHFWVGMIKAPFIGFVIGVIACAEGLQVKGSTASLGQHTTQSVVKSIFMVIIMDGLFALFFSAIRM